MLAIAAAAVALALAYNVTKPTGLDGTTPVWDLGRPAAQAIREPERGPALETCSSCYRGGSGEAFPTVDIAAAEKPDMRNQRVKANKQIRSSRRSSIGRISAYRSKKESPKVPNRVVKASSISASAK